jgi:hypothetical protein
MQDKQLKELIQSADIGPRTADENPADLAARVRMLHRRRGRRRLVAATTAALVVSGCLVWRLAPHGHVAQPRQTPPNVASTPIVEAGELKAALRATMEQIGREERIVRALLAAERARRLGQQAREISGRIPLPASRDEQVGPVAASYLVSGDDKQKIGLPVALAKADYARVIELFPGTVWADRAKARLASLQR